MSMERIQEVADRRLFNYMRREIITGNVCILHRRRVWRNADGCIDRDQGIIYLRIGQSLQERVITVMHEFIHLRLDTDDDELVEREAQRLFNALTISQLGFLEFVSRQVDEE